MASCSSRGGTTACQIFHPKLYQVPKKATCHTLRHSFATHLLENGVNIRAVYELMGQTDVKTTGIYTHVMKKDLNAVVSPLDSRL